MFQYYVYILECSDKSLYVGVTYNLLLRVSQHEQGLVEGYTAARLPVRLLKSFLFNDIRHAINFEKQVKRWSRKKKLALVNEDWDLIQKLSKNYTQFGKLTLRQAQGDTDVSW